VAKAEKTQISRAKTLKQACFSALTGVILILNASLNAWAYSNDEIANAIYRAEGGSKTSHPYGILAHYKTTTPRQACLNTIAHARRDWNGEGDFVSFLGSRYAPLNVANDPTGLNRNWISNVKYFLAKGA
jgi:hypothetical protein